MDCIIDAHITTLDLYCLPCSSAAYVMFKLTGPMIL